MLRESWLARGVMRCLIARMVADTRQSLNDLGSFHRSCFGDNSVLETSLCCILRSCFRFPLALKQVSSCRYRHHQEPSANLWSHLIIEADEIRDSVGSLHKEAQSHLQPPSLLLVDRSATVKICIKRVRCLHQPMQTSSSLSE